LISARTKVESYVNLACSPYTPVMVSKVKYAVRSMAASPPDCSRSTAPLMDPVYPEARAG